MFLLLLLHTPPPFLISAYCVQFIFRTQSSTMQGTRGHRLECVEILIEMQKLCSCHRLQFGGRMLYNRAALPRSGGRCPPQRINHTPPVCGRDIWVSHPSIPHGHVFLMERGELRSDGKMKREKKTRVGKFFCFVLNHYKTLLKKLN